METLYRKTPMARKEALAYCRRCLAVMLCCVLVFGLTVPATPRATAAVTDVAIVGMGGMSGGASWGASTPGSMAYGDPVGACIAQVAMLGSDAISSFICGYAHGGTNTKYYGSAGYEAGAACWDYLENLGGDIGAWCADVYAHFSSKGGVAPGDTIKIPREVAQAVQQWTNTNFDFVGDALSLEDDFLFGENDIFVLTKVDAAELEAYTGSRNKSFTLPLRRSGQVVPVYIGDLYASYTHDDMVADKIVFTSVYNLADDKRSFGLGLRVNLHKGALSTSDTTNLSVGANSSSVSDFNMILEKASQCNSVEPFATLFYSNDRIYAGNLYPSRDYVTVTSYGYVTCDNLKKASVSTTITKNPAIDKPVEAERTVVVPDGLPMTEINGTTVPVFDDVTAGDVVIGGADDPAIPTAAPGITAGEITNAITDALPITGTKAGDQVVDEVMAEPDSLGAVFISKFPFSIPWDLAKTIGLLAAPPVTPRFEVDFLEPIGYRVGGWNGSTKVVLDFSEFEIVGQLCRWFSSIAFIFALISGTKQYIWTA